ncbi:MAG: TatD family deoxyribonuclease [Erysipelotrichia bacterium]|nr:TatD family deoxyribonuclease [Erysipelotrichia bacterium]NCC55198.1 TatD family deoxyribonuclease [Erysipelotrichia bacterium]
MRYGLIDSHCHITCDELYERVDEIIANAKNANVQRMLVVCTHFDEFERAISLQKHYDCIDIAMGFHPSNLYDFNEADYKRLEKIIQNNEIVALGEIGLDYHWDDVAKEDQESGFIRQIQLANQYHMPILIHMRDATKDTLDILREYAKTKFMMHCYSGSKESAKEIMRMGDYLSFAGPITFKNARGLNEVPQVCDIHKIMVETDCPYLTPHPYRGKRNEVMYVNYTFDKVAELLDMDKEILAKQMLENYEQFMKR